MVNQNKSLLSTLENYLDMLLNIGSIYIAFFFNCLILGDPAPAIVVTNPIPVMIILAVALTSAFLYHALSNYTHHLYQKSYLAIIAIIKSNLIFFGALAIIFALFSTAATKTFLLTWTILAFVFSSIFLAFKKKVIISVLNLLHEKQFILRKVILVGDNLATVKEFVRQVSGNPQYGIMVTGYVGSIDENAISCDKLGGVDKLAEIIDKYKPTDVVFAIDAYDKGHIIRLVNTCDDKCVRVYFLPVIFGFFKSERQIESVGTLPIINVHNTPLNNKANALIKRLIDIVGSLLLIVLTSPIMLIAAIGTKISSPGPVLFKQERVGKMGERFTMLKFRSMAMHAEDGLNSQKTKFGTFLRKTSIDELPQLFNVLMGSMSLVGPRPEIPKFVEEFKEVIPLYMVKHYVKPGMTGLAQIRGLRGDTSVEERIHTDIQYIENWSLLLDISILLRTPFKVFNKQEKYVEREQAEQTAVSATANPELFEIHEALYGNTAMDESADASAVGYSPSKPTIDHEKTKTMAEEAEYPITVEILETIRREEKEEKEKAAEEAAAEAVAESNREEPSVWDADDIYPHDEKTSEEASEDSQKSNNTSDT